MASVYAYQIKRRRITILDVPEDLRDKVMALLDDCDRRRMEALLSSE